MRALGRQKSPVMLILMIVLGMILGSAVGEAIGHIFPKGPVRAFFLEPVEWGWGPSDLYLVAFTITFGLSIKVNIMAVLGVVFASYLFRWY